MSAPSRITKEQLLEEFNRDGINCDVNPNSNTIARADYVDDTFTAVHETVNRILDERLSKIEQVLNPTF